MSRQTVRKELAFPYTHLAGATIQAQVGYGETAAGLATARLIVFAKLRNCRSLLTNFRQARERFRHPAAAFLQSSQAALAQLQKDSKEAANMRSLFLIEARSAAIYWQVLCRICKQQPSWRRAHPGGEDPLNRLLNAGYTILARHCREAIVVAGLLPQLGVMHGITTPEPLVHDLMEIFRQPACDAVIVPLFSRKQKTVVRLPRRDMSRGMTRLHGRFEDHFLYGGRCEKLRTIVYREAVALRMAIIAGEPWQPYHHSWRHGRSCRQEKKDQPKMTGRTK